MKKTILTSILLAAMVAGTHAQINQNFESGSRPSEEAKGWVFGAQAVTNSFVNGGSPVQGSFSCQTNALSSSSLSASWVKTPWAIWSAGTISMDARLDRTGANTYTVSFRFIPWDKCGSNEEGTTTAVLYDYTMPNSIDVQTISFAVPAVVLDGKPWRMRVSFTGTGGSTRIVHDDYMLPAAAAFYDTDGDNIPDALDKYPGDATNAGKAAILARAWDDLDADGIQDNCEPGVMGATVRLRNSSGGAFSPDVTSTTAYNGYVTFFDIVSGGSRVLEFLKPTTTFGYTLQNQGTDDNIDSDIGSNGRTASFPVSGVVTNVAGGYLAPGTITTFVWDDQDGDGIQDSGEPGLSGRTVSLRNSGGTQIATATTLANGIAVFTNIPVGTTYHLRYTVPAGNSITVANQGTDDAVDSDAGQVSPFRTPDFSLTQSGQNYTLMDCGMWAPGTVTTFVWDDQDGDGIQDSGEPGLSGRAVSLRNSVGTQIGSATTDASGIAVFTNVPTGINLHLRYTVPAGNSITIANQGTDDALDSDAGQASPFRTADFSLTQGSQNYTLMDCGMILPGMVTVRVWNDLDADGLQDIGEPGLSGLIVRVRNSTSGSVINSATTDASGIAVFNNLPTGQTVYLNFVRPTVSWVISPKDVGTDDDIDSDAGLVNPFRTDDFMLTLSGQNFTQMDCGMYDPSVSPVIGGMMLTNAANTSPKSGINLLAAGKEGSVSSRDINVYPNPARSTVNVVMGLQENSTVNYSLMDVSGKVIRSGNWKLSAGVNTVSLDVMSLQGGVYILRVDDGKGIQSKKIMVNRR